MPTLALRTVGMSYILERIATSGLDGEALLADLSSAYGPAVALLSTPRSLDDPIAADEPPPIDALIVDRKAATWDGFRSWLEAWVTGRGFGYVSWAEDALSKGTTATLHFHDASV